MSFQHTAVPDQLAAIDIGSNSFHMLIAKIEQGELRPIERIGEKVQLAANMRDGQLDPAAIERGLACLARFEQRLRELSTQDAVIRVVGTNALRAAKNRKAFIEPGERILDCPIEVISGREEARLVYLGVAHTLADDDDSRLVVDIGGGSTEFIVGNRFEARLMESLHMGCVSFLRFFPDGVINRQHFEQAYRAAFREVLNIRDRYRGQWQNCVGSSGTLLAIEQVLLEAGLLEYGINHHGLVQLREMVLQFSHVDQVDLPGLKESRRQVFVTGVAICCALFDALAIKQMTTSEGALREGVLFDLIGRLNHEDVRERTVSALEQRYDTDQELGRKVERIALTGLLQVLEPWSLHDDRDHQLLAWASRLAEIGLAVSHSQFHKHGEYLLRHADLAGFSRREQEQLALLVRAHRRKFPSSEFALLAERDQRRLTYLAILLRLAVLLRHTQIEDEEWPEINFSAAENQLTLQFPAGWLARHPLTESDLQQEQQYLQAIAFQLLIS